MITKEDAVNSKIGDIFYHMSLVDSKNRPVRCRVSGLCK